MVDVNIEPLKEHEYTKYEKARLVGARALQISMGAPFLIKLSPKQLEELKYNPVEIAKRELEELGDDFPIQIKRRMPSEQ